MSIDIDYEPPYDKYIEEKNKLLAEQKNDLLKKLKKIQNQLDKKRDIEEFLASQMIYSKSFSGNEIKDKYKKCYVRFLIKFLGIVFVSFHLVAVFELNGILNAIKGELYSSALSYLLKRNRDKEDNYYSSYMKINNKIPSFSLFFLSSILSHFLKNFLGYTLLSIIILITNDLNIYFGLNNFGFHNFSNINDETETTEINYSLFQFLHLLIIFLVFYISLGIIALLPLEIVQNAFLMYEEYKEKKDLEEASLEFDQFMMNEYEESEDDSMDDIINNKKEKNDDVNEKKNKMEEIVKKMQDNINKNNLYTIQKDNINNNMDKDIMNKHDKNKDDNNDLLNDSNNKDKINNDDDKSNEGDSISLTSPEYELKGYLRFYLFSLSMSIILKLILNRIFVPEYKEDNKEKSNFYFICIYSISTILSLIFYFIFSTAFRKEKNKKKKIYTSMRFAGYIIYQEEIIREESSFCNNCGDIMNQLNYACCCHLCSITYLLKCIFCFKVNCEKYNHYKIRKNSEINKKEEICIIYKVSGKCAWLTDLLTETKILVFVIIIYIIELFNIGFKKVLTIDDENKDIGKKSFIINLICLLSIPIFYLIDRGGGLFVNKMLNKIDVNLFHDIPACVCGKEFTNITIGILLIIFCESIYTTIISSFIYYNKMYDNEYYFIPISIGCSEYFKLICLNFLSFHFKINDNEMEILSSSFVFSIYILIWSAISFIIDLLNAEINKLILFQFIFSIVIFGLLTFFFIMGIIDYCSVKKEKEQEKKNMISDELDSDLGLEDDKSENFGINKGIELSLKNVNDNE